MRQWMLLILFFVTLASGVAVLRLKYAVSKKVDELEVLAQQIHRDREDVRILEAEVAYKQSPERLEAHALRFLALMPPRPEQVLANPARIPFRPASYNGPYAEEENGEGKRDE